MKRLILVAVALLLTALPTHAAQHTVDYYFRSYCESCDPAEDFTAQFKALTGIDMSGCDFHAYNVVSASGRRVFETAMAKYGLSDEVLPMAVVDGVVYRGAGELNEKLPPDALRWGDGTMSQVVYLFTPACESCARAEAAVEALPESVAVKRGNLSFSSPVRVKRFDVTKETDIADALFDAYQIPDDDRVTPAVFLPGKALVGIAQIEEFLGSYVSLGWAVGEISAVPSEDKVIDAAGETGAVPSGNKPSGTAGLLGTLAAGLVAGFNGCALSMLLMFVSMVLSLRKNAWPAVAAFLLAKLACCFLIGSVLLEILQALNPTWLAPAVRVFLTVIMVLLAALTFRDAYFARRGELGSMKNQLPAGLRGKLHGAMRALAGKKLLIPASIALGFVIAAGEFLCAGQLYLARLVGGAGWTDGERFLNLAVYCLGFLAPSAVIAAAILLGRSAGAVSLALARHIALIKFLTAAAMLVLVALAWVI